MVMWSCDWDHTFTGRPMTMAHWAGWSGWSHHLSILSLSLSPVGVLGVWGGTQTRPFVLSDLIFVSPSKAVLSSGFRSFIVFLIHPDFSVVTFWSRPSPFLQVAHIPGHLPEQGRLGPGPSVPGRHLLLPRHHDVRLWWENASTS